MLPITDSFDHLKIEFEKSIITYDYYKVDLDDPENIHLKNMNDPYLIFEGHMFNLNGNALSGFYFKDLVNKTEEEIISNLKMPIDPQDLITYLENIIELSSKIEESIINKEGKWIHLNAIYEGFLFDDILGYEKEFLSDSLKEFKITFRNLIAFAESHKRSLEKQVQKINKNRINTDLGTKLDLSQTLFHEIITRSFQWKRKVLFNRDILLLFELLTQSEIIPKNTDFNDFIFAFSGEILQRPLRIKWLITGKNKQTSKSSLFHFISRLEDFKLIENKDWIKNNYMPLYQKISGIFVDKDNNMFTIDGLKSSRSQGILSDCAKQAEIEKIIAKVVNSITPKMD